MLTPLAGTFKGIDFRGNDPHPLAACTLIIGAPVGKNKIRVVDGKIENLWLINEETAHRLDNISMMAILLGYLQTFCAGHEVPHLSFIQKPDHPTWLKDFFTVAGFNRCECLKPETGGQRFRACLKLDHSGQAIEHRPVENGSANTKDQASSATRQEEVGAGASDPAVAATTKASETTATLNGASQLVEPRVSNSIVNHPLSDSQASEWLSQNKEILRLTTNTQPTARTVTTSVPTPAKITNESSTAGKESVTDNEMPPGLKRKRAQSVTKAPSSAPTESRERVNKEGADTEPGEIRIKQGHMDKSQPSKRNPESKLAKDPILRYSKTLAPQSSKVPKVNKARETEDKDMTDALLAQFSKPESKKSPKQIKEEASSISLRSALSQPPSDPPSHYWDTSSKGITCYYWYSQGYCKHNDDQCSYAHYDTGTVARPPSIHKKSKGSSYYGGYDGSWSDVNGGSVKKARGDGAPPATAKYDSWRP